MTLVEAGAKAGDGKEHEGITHVGLFIPHVLHPIVKVRRGTTS